RRLLRRLACTQSPHSPLPTATLFSSHAPPTTEIYTLSLHDALPISEIADYKDILGSPDRQRAIVGEELTQIVDKYGDERRTTILPYDGDMSIEDLIPEEDVVVTITRGGYAKRTRTDNYRAQHRGGK